MLQADLLLWVSHLSQRSFLGYTSLTLVKPKLSEWSREMHSFIFFKSSIRWKLPSVALLIERVTWEDDRWKTSESMSFYWTGILKIATNDHTLQLALRQPELIWEHVAHTQVQGVSNIVLLCYLTKDRLSSGGSVERLLEFKSRGVLLPLTVEPVQVTSWPSEPPHFWMRMWAVVVSRVLSSFQSPWVHALQYKIFLTLLQGLVFSYFSFWGSRGCYRLGNLSKIKQI